VLVWKHKLQPFPLASVFFFPPGYELLMPVMPNKQSIVVPKNRLLNAFDCESRARVDPHLERINFMLGDVICEAGGVLDHAYFPDGAVLSLLTVLKNGMAIETANIGREGAFGLFAAMYSKTSFNRCLVQLRGGLLRIPIKVLAIAHAPFEGVKMGRCLGLYFFGCGDIANMSQPSGDTAA
jgi:hypothetical protein